MGRGRGTRIEKRVTREAVEEPGEGSIIEASTEDLTQRKTVDALKQSWVTRAERRPLHLASRRTRLRERSRREYFQQRDQKPGDKR